MATPKLNIPTSSILYIVHIEEERWRPPPVCPPGRHKRPVAGWWPV